MAKTIKIMGAGISVETANELIQEALKEAKEQFKLEYLMAENPVGHIRFELENINPATYLGFGTWELWGVGQVPIGVDSSNTAINAPNKSTGSNSVTVTSASTTPGATGAATGNTGSTTPGATGAASGNTGSTTPGATGAWNGTSGSTAITIDQMPSHTHGSKSLTGEFWNYMGQEAEYTGTANGIFSMKKHDSQAPYSTAKFANNYDALYIDATHEHNSVGSGSGHSHSIPSHTHTSAAHTHDLGNHTHTSAAHSHDLGSHTHTSAAHTHSVTISTVQSSISCYMWRRVA